MTTHHTPGPWNVTKLYVRKQDGGLVASINDLWQKQKTPKAEMDANARLISAAPDLLRVVQDLMSDIIDLSTLSGDDVSSCHYLYDAARAAIDKATKGQ